MQIIGGSGLEVIEKVQVIEKTTVPPAQSRVGVREREREKDLPLQQRPTVGWF